MMKFSKILFILPFCILETKMKSNTAVATLQSNMGSINSIFPEIGNLKIVGGHSAKQGDFPYQLSLRSRGYHFCGGSLIRVAGQQVAITAAHCVVHHRDALSIVAGDVTISDTTGIEQTRQAQSIIIHEMYGNSLDNDIALIFLDKPYKLNEYIKVVSLPQENEETIGNLVISGWGRLYSGGPVANTLQYVEMPVVDQSTCQEKWINHPEFPKVIGDGILCSGVESGNMSTCHGDSGGPALSQSKGHLAGIVSFGDPSCGHPDYPGGFTNVAYYIRWIEENVEALTLTLHFISSR